MLLDTSDSFVFTIARNRNMRRRYLLMARHGVTEALTNRRHFEQAGFVRLLP